jgi:hypothetical protein
MLMRTGARSVGLGLLVAASLLIAPAVAVAGFEDAKLIASDGAASDWFGFSVALSGDMALIGAYGNDDNGDTSGSAYGFRFDGSNWVEEAKLTPSDAARSDAFGGAVAPSGDIALVGAEGDFFGSATGAAYVFRRNGSTWAEEEKLASTYRSGRRLCSADWSLATAELVSVDAAYGFGAA